MAAVRDKWDTLSTETPPTTSLFAVATTEVAVTRLVVVMAVTAMMAVLVAISLAISIVVVVFV